MGRTLSRPGPGRATGSRGIMLPGLRRARERAGLSLRELSEIAGMDYSMISKLENQRRGAQGRNVRKLAEALKVAPATLVDPPDTTAD